MISRADRNNKGRLGPIVEIEEPGEQERIERGDGRGFGRRERAGVLAELQARYSLGVSLTSTRTPGRSASVHGGSAAASAGHGTILRSDAKGCAAA